MKITKKISSCLVLFLMAVSTMVISQSDKGTIGYEIINITSDNPQIAANADMMKGTKTMVYYTGKKSLTKVDIMGGMMKIDVRINEDESSDLLMDMSMMGQKIWVNSTKLEADRMKAEEDNVMEEMDITYDKADTKTIAGFECYKMTVEFPDSEGATLEAYISEDIDVNAPIIQGVEIEGFNGFPLEYIFNNGMMAMTVSATSFESTVDESTFELNTSGFQKMTMGEFKDMMSSMGGGGFGF